MSFNSEVKLTINGNPQKGCDNGTERGTLETAIFIVSQAKALAPVDKGRLRNSISYKTQKESAGQFNNGGGQIAFSNEKISLEPENKFTAYAGTNVKKYPIYQEFGTRYQAPQPYMRPAGALAKGLSKTEVMIKLHDEEMEGPLKEGRRVIQF